MAYSTQEAVSDGTLTILDLSITYLDRSEIQVYFDTIEDALPWEWVGLTESKLEFYPAVPAGVGIQVRRTTDISAPRHVFSTGAAFTARSLDEDIRQVLHIAQEATEGLLIADIFNDLNMHANAIHNVKDAVELQDAVTLGQIIEADAGAVLAVLGAPMGSQFIGHLPAGAGAVATDVQSKLREILSPKDFGALGDGVADDGAALNLALAAFRNRVNAVANQAGCIELDLCGGVYRTTVSLNATGLSSWGWSIVNGTIIGECAGKAVLDMVGSRGGALRQLVVYGSASAMPRIGIQVARSTVGGQSAFCDNTIHDNVSVIGYYSLAPVYFYAQETTTYSHCRWWNYNYAGYAAILVGNDAIGSITSDYMTPVTGSHSYINNKYINCDIRYLPIGNSAAITGITKAASAVISAAGHPFVNGDVVTIGQITAGMTQINNLVGTVANAVAGVSFELSGVNSTAFSTYTAGGQVVRCQTKPSLYFSRGEQHHFDTCYIVNYGSDSIEWGFPDTNNPEQITMDVLFEGIGSASHLRFTHSAGTRTISDFKLRTYNTHCRDSLITSNASGGATLEFKDVEISVASLVYSSPTLLNNSANYKMYDADIYYPVSASFVPSSLAAFNGKTSFADTLVTTLYNNDIRSSLDQTYVPVVTPQAGAITSYTATGTYRKIGKLAFVHLDVTITDNGTGSGSIAITLPEFATPVGAILSGRENVVAGKMLQGQVASSSITVRNYDNTYPGATNARLIISGSYLTA